MEKTIFISYKSEEYSMAKMIKARLEKEGLDCWMAPESIEGGKSYAQQIPQAIQQCKVFVLILSKAAMESIWVAREVDRAINEKKTILPFWIDGAPMTDEFQFYLTNIQCYHGFTSFDSELQRMIDDIRRYTGIAKKSMAEAVQNKPELVTAAETTVSRGEPERKEVPASKAEAEKKEASPSKTMPEKQTEVPTSKTEPERATEVALNQLGPQESAKGKKEGTNLQMKPWIWGVTVAAVVVCVIIGIVVAVSNGKKGTEGSLNAKGSMDVEGSMGEAEEENSSPASTYAPRPLSITFGDKSINTYKNYVKVEGQIITEDSINGLSWFQDLGYLEFVDCEIQAKDLSPILTGKLRELNLSGCNLTKEQLSTLKIAGAKELSRVNLSGNEVDAAWLETLKDSVTILNVSNTGLNDLSLLKDFSGLTRLSAEDNGIEDLSPLVGLKYLESLSLDGNPIQDLSPLGRMDKLKKLSLNRCELQSLAGLEACIWITQLSADQNKLTSLDGLQNMTLLERVSLENNELSDVSVLTKSAETLQVLYVAGNQLESLPKLPGLTILNVKNNQLTELELTAYEHLEAIATDQNPLERLYLPNGCMTHVSLVGCAQLDENKTFVFAPFTYEKGQKLYADVTGVNSIKLFNFFYDYPLNKGLNIAVLSILGVGSVSSHEDLCKINGTDLFMEYDEDLDYTLLVKQWQNIYLVGCPLDKVAKLTKDQESVISRKVLNFVEYDEALETLSQVMPDLDDKKEALFNY